MKKAFSLLLIVLISFCQIAKANNHVTKLELRVDGIQNQLKNLKSRIESYEETQDPTLLKAIFREQKTLLNRASSNYRKYKKILGADLAAELQETRNLLLEARKNYLDSLKQSQQGGTIAEFQTNPSYWDVYNSLASDLDKLNRAVDEIEFAGLISSTTAGVYGKVYVISGNCMPTISENSDCGTVTSSATKVVIRKPVKYGDLNSENSSELVSTSMSNEEGFFFIALEPGLYSVLALDGETEYCNSMDGDGYACLVEVKESEPTEFDINIDKAVY